MAQLQVVIRRNGYKTGTCGWLAAGLQAGMLALVEGRLKSNGHHGLWLKSTDGALSQWLAAYDVYDVGSEYLDEAAYRPNSGDEPGDRESIWTDAAWNALRQIAVDWCAICNAERAEDEEVSIGITRVRSI